jgi:hypothetical protein
VYGELGGVIVTSTLRSQSQPGSCLALVADWSRSIRERHLGIHLGGGSGMAMWRDVVESWRTAGVQWDGVNRRTNEPLTRTPHRIIPTYSKFWVRPVRPQQRPRERSHRHSAAPTQLTNVHREYRSRLTSSAHILSNDTSTDPTHWHNWTLRLKVRDELCLTLCHSFVSEEHWLSPSQLYCNTLCLETVCCMTSSVPCVEDYLVLPCCHLLLLV